MRVLALRADNGGCAHYRLVLPAKAISKSGADVEITIRDNIRVKAEQNSVSGLYKVHQIDENVDLIVIQRPLNNYGVAIIRQAKKQGIATIVELDDDFDTVHRDNSAWELIQPDINKAENTEWLREATRICDLVTVSTPALVKYRSDYGGVRVLPNYVPQSIFNTTKLPRRTETNIGWTGMLSTHPHDLPVLGSSIKSTLLKYNKARFMVVGDKTGVARQLGLKEDDVLTTGVVPLDIYYQAVLDYIDIGLVPLELTPFNRAKSYLKLLEFTALGIPTIASPTEQNLTLHRHGIGLIANTPAEWRRHIDTLLRDGRKRTKISQTGREYVREYLTYEGNALRWVNAWQEAIDISKGH